MDTQHSGSHCTVRLLGDLDLNVRSQLTFSLDPLVYSSIAIIDATDVTFADTTLLNAVIRLVRERRTSGNDVPLRIAGASASVRHLFALTHIDRIVQFYDSIEDKALVQIPLNHVWHRYGRATAPFMQRQRVRRLWRDAELVAAYR
jgi:anti-anti-sigma factor